MGFVDRLRMNNLYPSTGIGPPDFNGGLDINALLRASAGNYSLPHPANSPMLPQIAQHMQAPTKPMDVVLGPNALSQARIGIEPDKGDLLNDPKTFLAQQKINQTGDIAQQKLNQAAELGGRRIDIQQQRADVYDFKAKHPNMVIRGTKGGNYQAIDPQTGESVDTGVDTGTMSEDELHKLIGQQKLEQIGAQGQIQKDLQNTRGSQALSQIGARITGQKDIQNNKPTSALLPTQQRVNFQNKANELRNTNPELGQFIHMNPDGTFDVDQPSGGGFFGGSGPTLDQYAKIQNALYPKTNTQALNTAIPPKTTAAPVTTPTNIPTGRIAVQDKDGKQFTIPESQLQQAITQGYTKVGGTEKK